MDSQYYIDLENQFGAQNYHPLDVVLTRGEGVWVYDAEGNRYLDCLSAYSAVSQGHVHPKILDTLVSQARQLTLTSRAFRNDQFSLLLKEISQLTGYEMALMMNSGAEAVETAIKAARKWGYVTKGIPRYQAEIIVAEGNFHGRTTTAISMSTEPAYRFDFGPFTPGFVTVPYDNPEALRSAVNENTAAILIEPIQGENGINIPQPGYLRFVRNFCDQNNILFIADEIQTGLGRTGTLFACDHENVRPDIMIVGKALSGGFYPVSGILADRPVLGLIQPGEHGSTFGGNPLGSAIARTALQVLVDEDMVGNSQRLGEYFLGRLQRIESGHIQEVRGRGLFIAVELKESSGGARRFCEALQMEGILAKETHSTVIRFAPPLIIDQATIDWAVPRIDKVLMMD
ncbi:MAG: ornithine--oxo-acid transaminase [Anaerolineae bacterium]|nr:ornithine--oxo-acid transaminase [Anaerolineae bacterium]